MDAPGRDIGSETLRAASARGDQLVRLLRVVVSSPSDVMPERAALQNAVDDVNQRVGQFVGTRIELWRWEKDATVGQHLRGPQGVIDEQMRIEDADLVIGVLWKRLGTPTGDAHSGTEHELRLACDLYDSVGHPQVWMYFCERPAYPQSIEELDQWKLVLRYRESRASHQLAGVYVDVDEFAQMVGDGLASWLSTRYDRTSATQTGRALERVDFNIPFAGKSFVGRERELAELDQGMDVARPRLVIRPVVGLGGVGKSQLAAEYVHRHRARYDVVAWIRAQDGGVGDLAGLADRLDLSMAGLSPQDRAGRALRWLSESRLRWLLVLDNVASADDMRSCCPTLGAGHVIVTSRDQRMRQFGALLTLGPLDASSAVDYLVELTESDGDRAGAWRLAADLGYLPLALCHAAALCRTSRDFDAYRRLLRRLPARELFDSHPELSYAQTVASTWKVSIAAAAERSRLAPRLLSVAAHLGPDAIPTTLFDGLARSPDRTAKDVGDALGVLSDLSLAVLSRKKDTVSVHRLVQKIVREDAPDGHEAAQRALAALVAAFPIDVTQPAEWPRCERLLSHVLAIRETSASQDAAALLKLLNRAGRYLLRAGQRRRAVAVADRTEQLARQILPDHRETLTARIQLAEAYQWFGRTS
jgi:hypothetical protein